jgi:hypothetical protein
MKVPKGIRELEERGVKVISLDIALSFMEEKPEWLEFKPKRKKRRKV